MNRRIITTLLVIAAAGALGCAEKAPADRGEPAKQAAKTPAQDPAQAKAAQPAPAKETAAAETPVKEPTAPEAKSPEPPPKEVAAVASPVYDLLQPLARADRYIPDDVVGLAVANAAVFESLLTQWVPADLFMIPKDKQKALEEEIAAYHRKKLGFAVRKIHSATIFVTGTGDAGVLVEADVEEGDAPRDPDMMVEGHRLLGFDFDPKARIFFIKGFGLALYGEQATPLASYLRGVNERTAGTEKRFTELKEVLAETKEAWFTAVVNVAHPLISSEWPKDAPFPRPDRMRLSFTETGFLVTLEGTQECLDAIDGLIQMGRSQAKLALTMAKAGLDELEVPEGTAVIIANALFDDVFDKVMPTREGNKMSLKLDLQIWGAVPIMGVLSAVAVPAFLKYIKRAKTSEAVENLDRISKGANSYFCTPQVDDTGTLKPHRFPPSQAATPAATCCASLGGPDADRDDRCDEAVDPWSSTTWKALGFQPDYSHHYVYEFTANDKTGSEAEFTASAYGDLDCDGIQATFRRQGRGRIGESGECEVERDHLFIENETE